MRSSSVVRARVERAPSATDMPPSPLLSACIRNRTYFAVTTISSAQMMRETTPITSAGRSAESLELAERGLQRIERARSDIAEDDADRAERENPKAAARALAVCGLGLTRRRRSGLPRKRMGHPDRPLGARPPAPLKTARVYTLPRAAREGPPVCLCAASRERTVRASSPPVPHVEPATRQKHPAFQCSGRVPRPG